MKEADIPYCHANWNPDFFLYSMVKMRNRIRSHLILQFFNLTNGQASTLDNSVNINIMYPFSGVVE